MRVAVVCTDAGIPAFGSKGASVHLQAVLTELQRAGHEVHLLTPRPGGLAPGRLAQVQVHVLPPVTGADAGSRERAARVSDAAVATVLNELASGAPVDLVWERYCLWGSSATAWAEVNEVPAVLEVNAPLVAEQLQHRQLLDRDGAERVAQEAMARATVVACVSDAVADWARSAGARPERVRVVPNGVDTDRITPGPPREPGEPFTIGFVGSLKPWHGTVHLLDAVALLSAGGLDCRLLVVGDGPEREALQRHCRQLGLDHVVELTGALPAAEVAGQLRRMDVGCAPYPPQQDFYFSPLKVYEYFAAGLPVVVSRVEGMAQLLDGGTLGRLVEPGDPVDLARALAGLAKDPAGRARMGAAARHAAVTGHTWLAVVERVLAYAAPVEVS